METVLFGYFFPAPAPAKFNLQKRNKIKEGKVWSWYKTGKNEVKRSSINFTDFFDISKTLASSESKSRANVLQ